MTDSKKIQKGEIDVVQRIKNDISQSKTTNIPSSIVQKLGRGLHNRQTHPICIIKELIYDYFNSLQTTKGRKFSTHDDIPPLSSTESNFDRLLIPKDHRARSKSDTYYVSDSHVLRTHTSAHQNELLEAGETAFLVTGDVYRKDEIDSTHYPVFHQMEGLYVDLDESMTEEEIKDDLIDTLKGLCNHLFPDCPVRVNSDYFPFTDPSFEMEVYHKDRWLEILGCGVIQSQIIKNCSESNPQLKSTKRSTGVKLGWAFGLGLERLAMILFEIPDIRLMWVDSDKFTSQFTPKTISKFKPYSVLDTIGKDVSFYIPHDQVEESPTGKVDNLEKVTDKKTGVVRVWTRENDMCDVIRETANSVYPDIIARVEMFDQFYNAKLSKLSRAYRIYYSPPDPEMSDPGRFTTIVNQLHADIAKEIGLALHLTIR
ncbi:phenylalanyl tRNA-synthetase [Yasminevirus sp. GU-2018]|uniref:phenylalanine--tRNA ligase n=1 Tax=Yasminevirus sp. GU-2018 TaxID=2420051 RepID=A0A5K0U9Y0_9VIRU|nr:phenylalanyl tRNA-synthetase [Yasminevirus sp. GU-2018]